MLISFTMRNWMSFRDETTFSMVASREQQHNDRLARLGSKYHSKRILPISSIYGGNASGKSNFCKALAFARTTVVFGTEKNHLAQRNPFKLEKAISHEPTLFAFSLLLGKDVYIYEFEFTSKEIVSERLLRYKSTTSSKIIFDRKWKDAPNKKRPGSVFSGNSSSDKLRSVLSLVPQHRLFVTSVMDQDVSLDECHVIRQLFEWFRRRLIVIGPDSSYGQLHDVLEKDEETSQGIRTIINRLDTGIENISLEQKDISQASSNIKEFFDKLSGKEAEQRANKRLFLRNKIRIRATEDGQSLLADEVVFHHAGKDGELVRFSLDEESDGTQRLLDIVPAFVHLVHTEKPVTFVIDELDRSLHSLLSIRLIEIFLESCEGGSNSQLIFTTHDLLLMDQKYLRRDEMWLAEKKQDGQSDLLSLADFKDIRNDKDIRKSYLLGRFGGIPSTYYFPTNQIFAREEEL